MIKSCQACGVEKDMDIKEVMEGENYSKTPTEPLFEIDCQPHDFGDSDWRRVLVCHKCYERLSPDMWISRRCWETLKPLIPFEQLEKLS